MNILLIICCFILPIISLKQNQPKLCIRCKYFIHDNDIGKFGKCSFFPTKEGNIDFLVNGIHQEKYHYCSVARMTDDMCGKEGKYYKKKIVKNQNLK